jgi:hypothetical protein
MSINPFYRKILKAIFVSSCIWIFQITKSIAQPYLDNYTVNANIGLVAGYSGTKQNMLEVGIGFQPWQVEGVFVKYPFAGFLALYEFDPNSRIYGTSFNAWYLSGLFACGLNANRYSDYKTDTYGIKPMIGISSFRIGLMYGYNIYLNDNSIQNLQKESITIRYYYPFWKKK